MIQGKSKNTQEKAGPERVRKIVEDVFSFSLAQRDHFDESVAEESQRLTQAKLGDICARCQSAQEFLANPQENKAAPALAAKDTSPKNHAPRRYHLLRLVSSKLSLVFSDPRESARMPRGAVMGIDAYLRRVLRKQVYTELNDQAARILLVSGRDDTSIVNSVNGNPGHRAFLQTLLVRFILSFKEFSVAKEALIDEMRDCTDSDEPEFTERHFHTMLNALFSDVFLAARSDGDQALFDYQFGGNTVRALDAVAKKISTDHQRVMARSP